MSRKIAVILTVVLLAAGINAAQQFAVGREYAHLWDTGHAGDVFAQMSGIEAASTGWITDCRERWLQLSQ